MANIVILHGNLGADPELRVSASGMGILKLRVATNERVKKGEEWVDHSEWHSVTVFGKRCEGLAKILHKGSKVMVTGKLRTTSYEKDGIKKYSTEILADDVELGGSKGDAHSSAPSEEPSGDLSVGSADIPF